MPSSLPPKKQAEVFFSVLPTQQGLFYAKLMVLNTSAIKWGVKIVIFFFPTVLSAR